MVKATLPPAAIAGNPPADASQPSGKNGMAVTVQRKLTIEPKAPSMPNFLFQNPTNNNAPKSHSETPRKYVAPLMPNTGNIQKMRGPCIKNGMRPCAS